MSDLIEVALKGSRNLDVPTGYLLGQLGVTQPAGQIHPKLPQRFQRLGPVHVLLDELSE